MFGIIHKKIFRFIYDKRLPHFLEDFEGSRVFMLSELPGGTEEWEGTRRKKTKLGNTFYWEPPDVFEKRKTGDCEDHAIWAWRQLHDMGYRSRLVLGDCGEGHAWVHIYVNGRVYLLEATQKHKWIPGTKSYDAHWSVERRENGKFAVYQHNYGKISQLWLYSLKVKGRGKSSVTSNQ